MRQRRDQLDGLSRLAYSKDMTNFEQPPIKKKYRILIETMNGKTWTLESDTTGIVSNTFISVDNYKFVIRNVVLIHISMNTNGDMR